MSLLFTYFSILCLCHNAGDGITGKKHAVLSKELSQCHNESYNLINRLKKEHLLDSIIYESQ
jgi:hypothetical protein